jgi:hypothetical protein
MSSTGAATLDLVPIRSAQHAARCALRKREREGREARRAVVAARSVVAQKLVARAQAAQVLDAAQQAHRRAVADCNNVGRPSATDDTTTPAATTSRAGSNDLMTLVRYCERAAVAVETRRTELQDAEEATAQARAHVESCSRAWSRLEQRASQVRDQLGVWIVREQVAIEMHGDLALEDEPHRSPPGARPSST